MIEVAVNQMQLNQELLKQFTDILKGKMSEQKLDKKQYECEIQAVYKELSLKLCHTRLGEFICVVQQTAAAEQGKSIQILELGKNCFYYTS